MRLYYHPASTNSRRALLAARQLAAPLELIFVDLATGANRRPEFLALNPNHRVPVLEDGAFVLWESYAIIQYLAERTAEQSVYPEGARERSDVNRWMFWCAQHFAPAVGMLNWEHFVKRLVGLGEPDPAQVARGETQVREFAAVLDAHLAGRDWLSGPTLSLADLAVGATLADTERARLPVTQYQHLQRWFAQITALEAWRASEGPARQG